MNELELSSEETIMNTGTSQTRNETKALKHLIQGKQF